MRCISSAHRHQLVPPLSASGALPAPPALALALGLVRLQVPSADVGGHRAPGVYLNALRFGPGAYLALAGPGVRVLTVGAGGRGVLSGAGRVGAGRWRIGRLLRLGVHAGCLALGLLRGVSLGPEPGGGAGTLVLPGGAGCHGDVDYDGHRTLTPPLAAGRLERPGATDNTPAGQVAVPLP